MTLSTRKSVSLLSPGCSRAKKTIGSWSLRHDHRPTSSTVSGKSGRARSMRSRTSARATSMSWPASKLTWIQTESSLEPLSMRSMPVSVRSCSSSTRVTFSSFSWALAPGLRAQICSAGSTMPSGIIWIGMRE